MDVARSKEHAKIEAVGDVRDDGRMLNGGAQTTLT